MIKVTKEFSWDMAHMLADHKGLCRNLHGHTYRMQVTIARKDEHLIKSNKSSEGMVLDFKDIKKIVNQEIIDPLDHGFMYWIHSPDKTEHEVAELLEKTGKKVAAVEFRPTAEEMSIDFFNRLEDRFSGLGVTVLSIKVWETPSSYAEATERISNEHPRV